MYNITTEAIHFGAFGCCAFKSLYFIAKLVFIVNLIEFISRKEKKITNLHLTLNIDRKFVYKQKIEINYGIFCCCYLRLL